MDEVILVVDDEPFVLNTVCSILTRAGFRVLRAGSPEDALRIGVERLDPIHLMVSDVIMPGLTGPCLADQFAALHRETQCLFMAGLTDTPEISDRVLALGRAFLPKPFIPQALVDKVREVLGPSQAAAASA